MARRHAMVQRILQIVLPVLAIVVVGYLFGRKVRPDISAVNQMNMEVFLPALILGALSSKEFSLAANRGLILGSLGVVLGSGLVAWPIARWLKVDVRTFVPPMMFNNCGNVGLPLAVLAFGEATLPAAVALFATSNLLHFTLGYSIVRRDAHFGHFLRSPMILATAGGVALSAAGIGLPGLVGVAVRMTGEVAVPLMIFTLGVRLASTPMGSWRVGVAGALVRPLAGLGVALLLGPLLGLSPLHRGMLYLFASLPPAILNFMLAERYQQEPDKVASIVLMGTLASLVFVPLGLALALGPS
jgi:hypothetical protein